MSILSLKNIVGALHSGDRRVIIENTYYIEVYENELMSVMNRLIEICVSCGNRVLEDCIMDTLESGAGLSGIQNVNFSPLVKMFDSGKYSDRFWYLVIIIGGSLQIGYIDFLNSIEIDDEFLKKEISDAVYELKYSKYNDLQGENAVSEKK